jgi:hypothetical protein
MGMAHCASGGGRRSGCAGAVVEQSDSVHVLTWAAAMAPDRRRCAGRSLARRK